MMDEIYKMTDDEIKDYIEVLWIEWKHGNRKKKEIIQEQILDCEDELRCRRYNIEF